MAVSFLTTRLLTPNLATYTHSAVTFGAEAADRYIAVAVSAVAGTLRTVTSVTIGGVTASVAAVVDVNNALGLAIAIAAVPTGESGDIVVTYSGAVNANHIAVWRITGIDSETAHDTVTATGAAASDMNGALDVVSGGVLIAAEAFFGDSRQRASGGSAAPGSTASDFAVSVDNTGATAAWTGVAVDYTDLLEGTTSVSQAFAAVSWAPSSAGGVTGTLATQESGVDTAALAGAVLVAGALSATEPGADTAELAGSVLVSGTMDAAEAGSDTFASTSVVRRANADDAPVRTRRRLRPEQIIAIVEAIREAEEQAKPAPTRTKRKALARKIVAAVEDHIYAPARKPVERVVQRQVAQFYQPGISWAEVSTAVSRAIQAAEAEARRIEQEIEEEDETFLLLVA